MNIRYVLNQFGLLMLVFAGCMAVLAGSFFGIEGALRHEVQASARLALVLSAGTGLLLGGVIWGATRTAPRTLGRREALLLVAMSWVLGAAVAALPFYLWANLPPRAPADHAFREFVNCYFEAMSGLTTTGATVLSDIEAIPRSLLLWRATTHWLGGLGIVVLFVAVLPSLGVGGKKLFRVEAPGPKAEGLQPQIRETARVLWFIYLGLTVVQIAALALAGMKWFDAICHTFGTLATGGFSTHNASMGHYHEQPAIQLIVVLFMVLAGMNFGLFYQLIRRRWRNVLQDAELRLYLIMLLLGSALIFVDIAAHPIRLTTGEIIPPNGATAVREAVFTTVSIQTTTGFCTSDFVDWPFLSKAVLVMLMFVGGCAGSTAGGIKVTRVWIAMKVMFSEIERVYRPNVVRTVRLGGGTIDADLKQATLAYVLGIILLFVAGAGAIMILERHFNDGVECSFTTAATASVATLCTIGPGLDAVGAVENYGWFSAPSKLVMCILMSLGRLEVFAIIVLFTKRFWRGD